MKAVDDATHCAAVCCGKSKFLACVNGPGGGTILTTRLQPWPYDLIQEWGFERPHFEDLGGIAGEPIVHAVADATRDHVVGVTAHHLFTVDFAGPEGPNRGGSFDLRARCGGFKGKHCWPGRSRPPVALQLPDAETRTASVQVACRPLGKVACGLGQVSAERVTLYGG